MGHAPMTNLTPAEAHLHLPWSTWLLHLCPVTADFLSAAPQYILLTFWSWQVRIFVFNRGGQNADKFWEEGASFAQKWHSLHRNDKIHLPELNLKTKWIWQLFWPFVIYFKVNEYVCSLLSPEPGSGWHTWNPRIFLQLDKMASNILDLFWCTEVTFHIKL